MIKFMVNLWAFMFAEGKTSKYQSFIIDYLGGKV